MTNADEIRTMSDEELAKLLSCPFTNKNNYGGKCTEEIDFDCDICVLEWLQSEAE